MNLVAPILPTCRPTPWLVVLGVWLVWMPASSGLGWFQQPDAPAGGVEPRGPDERLAAEVRVIRVPLPIRGNVDQQVRGAIESWLTELPSEPASRPILVLEFSGRAGVDAKASQFERSLALARFLTSSALARVRTVAYLPESVRGHAVLVALACEQIMMHPDAELGEAGVEETTFDPTMVRGYREIVQRRGTIPFELALGMLDPSVEVVAIETARGTLIALANEVDTVRQQEVVRNVTTLVPAGQAGLFTGRTLRIDLQLISQIASDRVQLAAALGVAPELLEVDPSLGRGWTAIRVDLQGPLHAGIVGRIQQAIRHGLAERDANLVFLKLDSPGGDPLASVELADFLIQLRRDAIRTVAYVDRQARGDAALVAWSCDQLVMAPEAILGGSGAVVMTGEQLSDLRVAVQDFARQRGRAWSPMVALLDPDVTLRRYARPGGGVELFLSSEEADKLANDAGWVAGDAVGEPGRVLELNGQQAESMRLARYTAGDFTEAVSLYGLEEPPVRVEAKWAYQLIDNLARPEVAATLLFLGGFAIFAELSSPGLGVGGFLGALCLILYFWSNYLHGTAEWLEISLFVLGFVCVLLEIFVLPGFGIFGLGGGLLVLASLFLATQTFILPRNDYQYAQLPRSFGMVSAMIIGLWVGAFVMGRYMHQLPFFRHLALPALSGESLQRLRQRESLGDFADLVGATGKVTTPLRPSGKVRFGDRLVDVVSDGEPIEVGEQVQVQQVSGTKVMVSRVEMG